MHLIRDAGRRADHAMMNCAVALSAQRCEANLCTKITDDRFPNAADLCEEALCEFSELFAVDGSADNNEELDFFECRFNLSLQDFPH